MQGNTKDVMVGVLAFYSNDPSLNPAEVSNFDSGEIVLKESKYTKNRPIQIFREWTVETHPSQE